MNSSDPLRQAITAAKEGRRAQARALLLDVVQSDPQNEIAWLWLSDQLDDLGDRIVALENALKVNPNNTKARERLDGLRRERQQALDRKAATLQEQFQAALRVAKAGRRQEALDLLLKYVQNDERNEQAWLLLSELAPDVKDQIVALENALSLQPENAKTQSRLDQLRRLQKDPLASGEMYEARGELGLAVAAYISASTQAHSPAERIEANRRLEDAQRRLASPKTRLVSPTLTVARLTPGLPLLYGLVIWIQGGLNPLHVPLLFYVGGLGVLLGSFLIVATTTKPRHPLWLAILKTPVGASEPTSLLLLEVAGWVMLLAPFAFFFVSAVERLNAYQGPIP